MNIDDMIDDLWSVLLRKLHFFQIEFSDWHQSVFGPSEKPVYLCARDESWEITASDSECATCRRHSKYDMQVISGFLNEKVPHILLSLLHSLPFCLVFYLVTHVFLFLLIEQSRNHSYRQ